MSCHDVDSLIEAVADGTMAEGDAGAHLASCARCQARLRLARSIGRVLETRETPEPPPGFTAAVMRRVQRERWRSEQLVDAGFNIAVAVGIGFIVFGLAALAWSLGWFPVDREAVRIVASAVQEQLAQASGQLQMIGIAALLLTSALGLWWWVEGEASF